MSAVAMLESLGCPFRVEKTSDVAKLVIAAAGVYSVGRYLASLVTPTYRAIGRNTWGLLNARSVSQRKRAEIEAQIARALKWCDELVASPSVDSRVIFASTAAQLVEMQSMGRITAVQLLAVFVRSAVEAHRNTNCLTWIDITDAIKDAEAADTRREAGEPLGALHGVPISIKDNISVRGADSTLGAVSYAFQPENHDSGIVKLIRRAGGIVFAKTNIPQTLVAYESTNFVFGTCTNPCNNKYTPGGSSGGEGALVALNGSVIGIGSDIGGSIRIPAHFCGVFGLKPSQWRVPSVGQRVPMPGQEAVASVCGPMARSVDDLVTMFRVLVNDNQSVDGNVSCVPFREDMFDEARTQRRITVGYYTDDGFLAASPACQRAVRIAVKALESRGHKCVPVTPGGLGVEGVKLYYRLMSAEGAHTLRNALGTEPIIPHISVLMTMISMPRPVVHLLSFVLRNLARDSVMADLLLNIGEASISEYWVMHKQRQDMRNAAAVAMAEQGVDVLLCPGLPTPAVPLGGGKQASMLAMMTALLNLLDMPTVTVPVTEVDPACDAWTEPVSSRCPVIERRIRGLYDAQAMEGLPVGVQLYATKGTDEKILGYAAVLEDALRGSQ